MIDASLDHAIRNAPILVVDDIATNVEMVTGLLNLGGFSGVDGTTDPAQGLVMVAEGDYDLILLDMRMPEIDGLEFIARMQASARADKPAVIVLTAQTDEETRRSALSAGARDFINKPFKLWELTQRVRNTLEIQILYRRAREFNVVLEARVEERTRELRDSQLDVVHRLATAAEFRDNETGQHIIRMSVIAHHLALAFGISETEAASIRDAAPLHDIGKIGIPDAILLKRGRLDPDEWEIMKRHAEIGAKILEGAISPPVALAREIALCHHEKWDGSGYPRGLKGEEIPVAGRIIAVADVFDALTAERPYKKAWTIDAAASYITDNAGKHFDPALVDIFRRELSAIIELKERFRD